MADDTKTLVSKWVLDASSWAAAVKEAKAALAELSSASKESASQDASASDKAVSGIKEQGIAQKELTAGTAARSAELKQQTAATVQQAAATKAATTAAVAGAAEEKAARVSQITSWLDGLKRVELQIANIKKETAEAGEQNILSKVAQSGAQGLLGRGALGGIASSLITGGALAGGIVAVDALTEGFGELIAKMKEFIEDSGSLQKVIDTFQKLSTGKGINAGEFIEQLRSSTHNLVNDVDLYREANTFMQSGLKLTQADMVKLTEATVGLARAQGQDATTAVNALTRAYLGGRTQTLAQITGIQRQELQVRGLGSALSETAKTNISFTQAQKLIEDRFANLGQPLLTYTDRLTQLKVVTNQFFEDTAQAAVKSAGFGSFMAGLGQLIDRMGTLEPLAKRIGEAIGSMFESFTPLASQVPAIISSLKEMFDSLGKTVTDTVGGFNTLDEAAQAANDKFTSIHPILAASVTLFAYLGGAIRQVAADLTFLSNTYDNWSKREDALPSKVGNNIVSGIKQLASGNVGAGLKSIIVGNPEQGTQSNYDEQKAQLKAQTQQIQRDVDASIQGVGANVLGQDKIKTAKDTLEQQKDAISKEQEANEKMYKASGESAKQYYATKKELSARSLTDTINELKTEQKAKEDAVSQKLKTNVYSGTDAQQLRAAYDERQAIEQEYSQKIANAGKPGGVVIPAPPPDPALAHREAVAAAKIAMEEKLKAAEDTLAKQKELISEEQDAEEQLYKTGNEEAQKYYADKKQYAIASYNATIDSINLEAQAQRDQLKAQIAEGNIPTTSLKEISLDADRKAAAAKEQLEKATNAAILGYDTDLQQAQMKTVEGTLQAEKIAIADRAAATQKGFQLGEISANDYLQERLQQITDEVTATEDAENQKVEIMKKSPSQAAASLAIITSAVANAKKQLDALANESLQQVFENSAKQYSNALSSNQNLQSIAQTPGGTQLLGVSQKDLQDQQQQLLQAQIASMEQLLQAAQPYSNTWYQIYENILKATQQAQQLSAEMQKQYALSTEVGGVFGAIADAGQSIFKGGFGSSFISSLGSGAKGLADTTQVQQKLATGLDVLKPGGGQKQDPLQPIVAEAQKAADGLSTGSQESTTALSSFTTGLTTSLQQLQAAFQNFIAFLNQTTGSKIPGEESPVSASTFGGGAFPELPAYQAPKVSLAGGAAGGGAQQTGIFAALQQNIAAISSNKPGSFGALTNTLTTAATAVGSFASTIANATSPLGGAIGGAEAGGGLGGELTKGLSGIAGTLGPIIGSAVGLLAGLFTGSKMQQIHTNIVDMQNAALAMNTAFSSGNASLNQTISTLQGMITTLTTEMDNSKKGGQQYAQLIEQYTQQLDQLQSQATQTMETLQEQLTSISQPAAYQQWVSSIDSVIQQYAQFAGAATNATQLAQANEFLSSSLQNIAQQMGDQLLQDEETQIQNALQLNDLYNQRNQLQLTYLNQVEGIMASGNVTRQMTQAQTKFSQLYDAQVNYAQQLDSINQQINLAQYQLSAAQQIFNLATTKAWLEQQLLNLQ